MMLRVMTRGRSRLLIGYCLMALSMPALMAQVGLGEKVQGEKVPGEEVIDTSSWRRIEGRDVPDYVIVSSFFNTVSVIAEMGEERYLAFARTFGFSTEKGSCCPLEILTRAYQEATLARKVRLVDEELLNNPTAYREHQNRAVRAKAIKLGEIYGRFLTELEEAGMPIESFMKTLDAQIRPTVSIVTDDDPEDISLHLDKDFYEGLVSRFPLELERQ